MNLSGIPIVVTNLLCREEVDHTAPKRRHRKSRIQKKWIKRYGYKTKIVDGDPFMMGGTMYMSQRQLDAVKAKLSTT